MDVTITTQRERRATFADQLAFTKIKQVLQVLRRGNHFTQGYPDIQALWAKGFLRLADEIRTAGRLRLADPVPSMSQQVSVNRPSTLLQALPLCRLPYQSTWIEWAPEDRRADEALFVPNGLTVPKYEGVLLFALEPSLRRFGAIPVWRHATCDIPMMPSMVMVFDFRPESQPTKEDIEERVCTLLDRHHRQSGYCKELQKDMKEAVALAELGLRCVTIRNPLHVEALDQLEYRDHQMLTRLDHEAEVDTSGDARFIMAVLALLNARNATERTPVKAEGSNRIRIGGPPLMAHHVVSLDLSRIARNRLKGETVAERRAHLVRGHFKVRKTARNPEGVDLFWWNPHVRRG